MTAEAAATDLAPARPAARWPSGPICRSATSCDARDPARARRSTTIGSAGALAMGRTPVREALKRLEAERLVVAHPRRGTFATDVNITDLRHIFEVRQQLEPFAAAAAAERATGAERRALTELRRDAAPARACAGSRPADLMRLDLRVHRGDLRGHPQPVSSRTRWCATTTSPPASGACSPTGCPIWPATSTSTGRCCGHHRADAADDAAELAAGHVARFEHAIRAVI